MYFELFKNKKIRAFPVNEYRYNIDVDESCYAVRFIYDGVEYIIYVFNSSEKAFEKSTYINKKSGIVTDVIEVTRLSDTKYEYNKVSLGSINGTFEQEPIDQFAIHGRRVKINVPKGAETFC